MTLRTAAATAGLLPLLVAQGVRVRRDTPRLPGAAGPVVGSVGMGPVLRLVVLGESTVAGVGAATHADGLTGRLAVELADRFDVSVTWRAAGRIGANVATVRRQVLPQLAGRAADVVVVACGVNDVIEFTPTTRWRVGLLRLLVELRRSLGPVPVVLTGVPPMGRFPSLPQPLRTVLGLRARDLDDAAARLAARLSGVVHVPMPADVLTGSTFCPDRFHPSQAGYALWAEHLADAITGADLVVRPAPPLAPTGG